MLNQLELFILILSLAICTIVQNHKNQNSSTTLRIDLTVLFLMDARMMLACITRVCVCLRVYVCACVRYKMNVHL